MTLLIGALTLGIILALLALGVYVSYRIFDIADITVDGSLTFGAAVASVLLVRHGIHPLWACCAGFAAGATAGLVSGILQTRFRINSLLAGILVMTALYSVNLHVMGRSNIPFLGTVTVATYCEQLGVAWFGAAETDLWGWTVSSADLTMLLLMFALVSCVALALWAFLRTDIGTAMRASGDNPQMIRALGGNVENYRIFGLAVANGLVGLAGALWAQYQNFADVQMGIGMVVWGLASVIIGEALTGASSVGVAIVGTIVGSILFRQLVAIALSFGLNPNDLKLVTAVFVFAALILPDMMGKLSARKQPGVA
ncbi:ABC transporter permease [Methylovulum psychrotolerans]|uniref:ABC transporter permease n=1 Tax=Methylovulum psychrotolerans TaxID=1704499 RepID=A0A1Z4BTZ6_9GAMM|nr:ABC transporter permease [Methylovulum psychrotolerans]ASF44796.1 ABC transporter permease [Methylovulum psychrotolerans]